MHQKLTGQFRINQTNMKVICFKSGYMQGCSYPFKKTINIKITIFRHKDNMEKLIVTILFSALTRMFPKPTFAP